MIDLLPPGGLRVSGHQLNGLDYILIPSVDSLLAQMQLGNAKHPQGKPEYDELLQKLRDTFKDMNFNERS